MRAPGLIVASTVLRKAGDALDSYDDKARRAGVPLGELGEEHRRVDRPVLHDERSSLGQATNSDRDVYYPNDPTWEPPREDLFEKYDEYLESPAAEAERTRDHPDYPVLRQFIEKDDENTRVDMQRYNEWLKQNRGIQMDDVLRGGNGP